MFPNFSVLCSHSDWLIRLPIILITPPIISIKPTIRLIRPLNKLIVPPIRLIRPPIRLNRPPIILIRPPNKLIRPPIRLIRPTIILIRPPITLIRPPIRLILPPIRLIRPQIILRETVPLQTSDMGEKKLSVLAHSFLLPLRAPYPPAVLQKLALIWSSNECASACFIPLIRMNEDDLSSCKKYVLIHSFQLHLRANF